MITRPPDLLRSRKMFDTWDDMVMPATASRLVGARIQFDSINHGFNFNNNARWNNEYVIWMTQMSHSYREGTDLEIHIHWDQAVNFLPNFCVEYRFVNIGAAFPALAGPVALTNNRAAFVANVHQVTDGVTVAGAALTLSHMIEVRLYRDTANASGLFAGADPYAPDVTVKELDIHYRRDSFGSWQEYLKWG